MYERQHIVPYSLRNHDFFLRTGMEITGASNMMYMPMWAGSTPIRCSAYTAVGRRSRRLTMQPWNWSSMRSRFWQNNTTGITVDASRSS